MLNGVIGFLSGVIGGMGIGGGAILIPALTMFFGVEQHTAQGLNVACFIPTAIFALIIHIKNKNVDIKTCVVIGLSGIVGAIVGSWLSSLIMSDMLRKLFGGFLLIIGVLEITKGIKLFKEKRTEKQGGSSDRSQNKQRPKN